MPKMKQPNRVRIAVLSGGNVALYILRIIRDNAAGAGVIKYKTAWYEVKYKIDWKDKKWLSPYYIESKDSVEPKQDENDIKGIDSRRKRIRVRYGGNS